MVELSRSCLVLKNDFKELIKKATKYCAAALTKIAYIRKLPDGKYRVFSEKGRNMGTYKTKEEAKKRLRAIEFFKHRKASQQNALDLSDLSDIGYSSIMRELNKNGNEEMTKFFMIEYKKCFDQSILQGENEDTVLPKTLDLFGKKYHIHFSSK